MPIGLFVGALLSDLGYWITSNPVCVEANLWLVGVGLGFGLLAASAGLTDFLGSPSIRALYHAHRHLVGNFCVLGLAVVSLTMRLTIAPSSAILPWEIAIAFLIVALLVYTGWHGGEMVFGHGVGMQPHEHGTSPATSRAHHSARRAAQEQHHGSGQHCMESDATVPQLVAFGGVSFIVLVVGMIAPANWVNMSLSAHDVGGANMAPGMITTRETPAAAMWDMAAVLPRYVTASYGLEVRGDQLLEPRMEDGVKVFDLETGVIRWTILPGVTVDAYAFNGQVPGPRLHIREGDHVRINVTNHLPESTTVHWHGLILPNAMDGPAEITQPPIQPGASYSYEFVASQSGTYFYHSHDHVDRQQALGLYGALIIDPAEPDSTTLATYDYVILLQEWLKRDGLTFPAMPMDGGQPNYFTINGRSFPATDTIRMKIGETLKVRFVGSNNGVIHPMHTHGGPFTVVARDGIALPPASRFQAHTIDVGPGQRYDVIWMARNPGKWLIHCHIGHHTTNNNVEDGGGGGLMMVIDVS